MFHSNSEISLTLPEKLHSFKNLFVKAGMEIYGKQNRVFSEDNTETPTPGYILVNAGFGTDVINKKKKTVLSFTILGNNLADLAYQSHLSRLKYFEQYPGNPTGRSGIYNMGRNISIKLTLPLNFRYR